MSVSDSSEQRINRRSALIRGATAVFSGTVTAGTSAAVMYNVGKIIADNHITTLPLPNEMNQVAEMHKASATQSVVVGTGAVGLMTTVLASTHRMSKAANEKIGRRYFATSLVEKAAAGLALVNTAGGIASLGAADTAADAERILKTYPLHDSNALENIAAFKNARLKEMPERFIFAAGASIAWLTGFLCKSDKLLPPADVKKTISR